MVEHYQNNEVKTGRVWLVATVLLLTLLVCGAGILLLRGQLEQTMARRQPPLSALEMERLLPPEPRLQATPSADGEAFRQEAQQELNSYGWVDREQGIVRVPLPLAQQVLLEQGWPHAH